MARKPSVKVVEATAEVIAPPPKPEAAKNLDEAIDGKLTFDLPGPPPSPALDGLRAVIEAVVQGKDLLQHAKEIERLVMGQETRANLVDSLIATADYERLMGFLTARRTLEFSLLGALNSGQLSPPEQLALLNYLNTETRNIEGKIKAGTTEMKDVMGLLLKLDASTAAGEASIAERVKLTTPQGREIVRRVLHRLGKATRKPRAKAQ